MNEREYQPFEVVVQDAIHLSTIEIGMLIDRLESECRQRMAGFAAMVDRLSEREVS